MNTLDIHKNIWVLKTTVINKRKLVITFSCVYTIVEAVNLNQEN